MSEQGKGGADPHGALARELNGETWSLLEKAGRSEAEDQRMIHAAHASCYHWLHAGTPLHEQRGEWLIARVYAVLGAGEAALRHAGRCRVLTEAHADLMQDFDRAYSCEGLARAHAVAGNAEEARRWKEQARKAGGSIAGEENRKIFVGDLDGGDWHGVD